MRELRTKFAELFGENTLNLAGNRLWLTRRILWRLQALAEGNLSERARRRAAELANDADLHSLPPAMPDRRDAVANERCGHAWQLLTRVYKGQTLQGAGPRL